VLRSLTRHFKIESDQRIGVAFSRSRVFIAAVAGAAKYPKILWTKESEIIPAMFNPVPDDSSTSSLNQLLMPLLDQIKEDVCPIHIVLPDHSVRNAIFELDELPKSRQMITALASWRMSKEFGRPEEELECQINVLGDDHGKHLLFVQAGDRYWMDKIRSALKTSGLLPWSMNAASVYRFNHLNDNGITPSSAMLSMDDDCWTLQAWDENNKIRFVMTRLRNRSAGIEEAESIGSEVSRVLRARLITSNDLKVKNLYLAGGKGDIEAVSDRINHELFGERITFDNHITGDAAELSKESSLKSLAIMAACTE